MAPIARSFGMRILMAAMAVALLSVSAHAQGMGHWPEHRKGTHQKAKPAKKNAEKKAADKAYKGALKRIPNSNAPDDPWKGMR
jgi:hypothetical protein